MISGLIINAVGGVQLPEPPFPAIIQIPTNIVQVWFLTYVYDIDAKYYHR